MTIPLPKDTRPRRTNLAARLLVLAALPALTLISVACTSSGSHNATNTLRSTAVSAPAAPNPAPNQQIFLTIRGQNTIMPTAVWSSGTFVATLRAGNLPGEMLTEGTWTQTLAAAPDQRDEMTFLFDNGDKLYVQDQLTQPSGASNSGTTSNPGADLDSVMTIAGGTGAYTGETGVLQGAVHFTTPEFDPQTGTIHTTFTGAVAGPTTAVAPGQAGYGR